MSSNDSPFHNLIIINDALQRHKKPRMSMKGVHRGNGIHYDPVLLQLARASGIKAQRLHDLLGALDRGYPLYDCVEKLRDQMRKEYPHEPFYR